MSNRRSFIKKSALFTGLLGSAPLSSILAREKLLEAPGTPTIISTWNHGIQANEAAWKVLVNNRSATDAVEAGVRVPESDPENTSVGLGGMPDRDGHVTLDACIMDPSAGKSDIGLRTIFIKES